MKKIITLIITGLVSFFINFYALVSGFCNHPSSGGCIPQSLIVWHTNFYSPAENPCIRDFFVPGGVCPASFNPYMFIIDIVIWVILSSIVFYIIKKIKNRKSRLSQTQQSSNLN